MKLVLEHIIVCLVAMTLFLPGTSFSGVFIHDDVTLKNQEIMITAETRGRVFSKGGQIVEFSVNGKTIGKSLSGGDGYAFKAYTPFREGKHVIAAQFGKDRDEGIILAVKKGRSVVCIDIEGSMISTPFEKKPLDNYREVIERVMKKYPVIYLQTTLLSVKLLREWLRENTIPESAVVSWRKGQIFSGLKKKNIGIKAVIGARSVIESAERHYPGILSFEDLAEADEGHELQ